MIKGMQRTLFSNDDDYQAFLKEYSPSFESCPDYLFHYTSAVGFAGIVATKKFWASNVRFLNDKEEFVHGLGLCRQLLQEKRSQDKGISKYVEIALRQMDPLLELSPYVVSFSQVPDLLSQWRAYCPDGGYAIGIARQTFTNNSATLMPCIYDEGKQKHYLDGLIERLLFPVRAGDVSDDSISRDDFLARATDFCYRLYAAIATFKHPTFGEEKEWRVVYPSPFKVSALELREKDSILIPYVEWTWRDKDDLRDTKVRVVVGLNRHAELARAGAELLLRKELGESQFEIEESNVPYRSI